MLNKDYLISIIFSIRRSDIYCHKSNGFVSDCGDFLFYESLDGMVNDVFNISMKVIYLLIDGHRTLEDIFEESKKIFEDVQEEKLLSDLIVSINAMGNRGIIGTLESVTSEAQKRKHREIMLSSYREKLRAKHGIV